MSALLCPYCQRKVAICEAPAAKFKAPCPGCGKVFTVRIYIRPTKGEVPTSESAAVAVRKDAPARQAKQPHYEKTPLRETVSATVEPGSSVPADIAALSGRQETLGRPAPQSTAENGSNSEATVDQPAASPADSPEESGDWLDKFLTAPDPEPHPDVVDEPDATVERRRQPILEEDDEGEDLLDATSENIAQTAARVIKDTMGFELEDVEQEEESEANATTDFTRSPPDDATTDFSADRHTQGALRETTDRVTPRSHAAARSQPGQTRGPLEDLPTTLGGYRIVQELGAGAMGAVYLAQQISLNRNVAIKLIQPHIASDPYYVARFTREAYAAAQLTHHNVVQIYDLGEARRMRFFSMEFVHGSDLGRILEEKGRLSPREAAGYVLQAARGLKFAHDHGLIHRDIKPANLILNDDGIVKVADLGLVKSVVDDHWQGQASSSSARGDDVDDVGMTMAQAAMGTPAYMPPEQADDAASVDHRADIYSLGCTLYTLVTGRQAFSGKTVAEVLTKHKTGKFTPPKVAVDSLPDELSEITLQMMARKPEDRYKDMSAVISAISRFLGQAAEDFQPRKEHMDLVDASMNAYLAAPLAGSHWKLWTGLYITILILLVVLSAAIGPDGGAIAVGLAALAPVAYFVYRGQAAGEYFYLKVRQYVIVGGPWLWLKMLVGGAGLGAILWLFGWFFSWMIGGVLAIGVAAALYHLIDQRLARSRREPLDNVAKLVRRLRQRGTDEARLQLFVAEQCGETWEQFYEDLYGYEAKVDMREKLALPKATARKHAGWRDQIIVWIDKQIKEIRAASDRRLLEKVERQKLEAGGLPPAKARERAEEAAAAMVEQAAILRESHPDHAIDPAQRRKMIKGMLMAARMGEGDKRTWAEKQLENAGRGVDRVLGSFARAMAGLVLIVGCLAWMNQNGLIPWNPLIHPAYNITDLDQLISKDYWVENQLSKEETMMFSAAYMRIKYVVTTPLMLEGVPLMWTAIFYSYGSAAAGIVLLLSALMGGRWNLLFMLPSAYILLLGEILGIPGIDLPDVYHIPPAGTCYAIGGLLAVMGLIVGRGGK